MILILYSHFYDSHIRCESHFDYNDMNFDSHFYDSHFAYNDMNFQLLLFQNPGDALLVVNL